MTQPSDGADRLLREELPGVAKGAAFSLVFQMLDKALGFAFAVLVPRLIGLANFGIYNVAVSGVYLTATLSLMGLPDGVVREGSVLQDRGEWGKFFGLARFALKSSSLLAALFTLASVLAAPAIASLLLHDAGLAWVIVACMLVMPPSAAAYLLVQLAGALRVVRYYSFVKLFCEPLLKVVCFVLLFWAGLRLGAVVAGFAVTALACLAIATALTAGLYRRLPRTPAEPVDGRAVLAYSLPLLGPMLLSSILVWADILLLGYFTADHAGVGLFSVALKIMLIPEVVPKSFTVPAAPRLASMLKDPGRGDWKEFYRQVGLWIFSLTGPFYLFFILRSDLSLRILSPEFEPGAPFLSVLCVGPFLCTVWGPADNLMAMAGKSRIQLANAVGVFALNVAANAIFLPVYGVMALAWVLTGTLLVYGVALAVEVVWIFRFRPVSGKVLRVLAALAPAVALLLWLGRHPLFGGAVPEFVFEAVASFSIYAVCLYLVAMDASDRRLLRETCDRIRAHVGEMRGASADRRFL